jgi:hypothetical protein
MYGKEEVEEVAKRLFVLAKMCGYEDDRKNALAYARRYAEAIFKIHGEASDEVRGCMTHPPPPATRPTSWAQLDTRTITRPRRQCSS